VFLHPTDHGRRSTHQDLDILRRFRTTLLNHILRHESNTALPALGGGIIEHKVQFELAFVVLGKLFELLPQQDIFLIDICKDKRQLGFVGGVFEDRTDDLEHGGDSRAACNHTECTHEARAVHHLSFGAFYFDGVADFHVADVFGDVAGWVALDVSSLVG